MQCLEEKEMLMTKDLLISEEIYYKLKKLNKKLQYKHIK